MLESFGARLRQRREQQGIDLIAIAAQTKIKMSLLEALERDDVTHWPSGIFRRAYIRAYAQAIALDPDVVCREFIEVFPEPADVVTTEALAAAVENGRPGSGPPTRLRYIVDSAIGSLTRLRRSPAPEMPRSAAQEPASREIRGFVQSSGRAIPQPEIAHELAGPVPNIDDAVEGQPSSVLEDFSAPETIAVDVTGLEWSLGVDDDSERETDDVRVEPVDPLSETAGAAESSPAEMFSPGPAQEPEIDLIALAELCTELGRVQTTDRAQQLLEEAAACLDASGLIVWMWDASAGGLRPVLACGYSDRVLAQLPAVARDADNATAAAFRSGRTSVIESTEHGSGALVVPMLAPSGCGGVLAIELQDRRETNASVRAAATILAALLAQLVASGEPSDARPTQETSLPLEPDVTVPILAATIRG